MKRTFLVGLFSFALLAEALAQSDALLGSWELTDEEDETLTVMHFLAQGILVQNDYYADGELECVYVYPYSVEAERLSIGEGLNWIYDADTGEYEPNEDFAEETREIDFDFAVEDGSLRLTLSQELAIQLLAEFLEVELDAELEIEGEALSLEDLLAIVAQAAGVEVEDLLDELEMGLEELETAFEQARHVDFAPSGRPLFIPPGSYTLPSGFTAVEEKSWGAIKEAIR